MDHLRDDAMSLAMFWAGLLMVLVPIISAGLVIGIWRYTKRRDARALQASGGAQQPDA